MITSTSTNGAGRAVRVRDELGVAQRPPPRAQSDGYAGETELSKLIRYGCMFELEVHQMEEQRQMQAENRRLKHDLERIPQAQLSEPKRKPRYRRATDPI